LAHSVGNKFPNFFESELSLFLEKGRNLLEQYPLAQIMHQ
jgi:hypothetical protein